MSRDHREAGRRRRTNHVTEEPRGQAREGTREGPRGSSRRTTESWMNTEASFVGDDLGFTHRRSSRYDRRRRSRLLGYVLIAFFAFILGLGVGYARGYFATGKEGPKVTVVIPNGASLNVIGQRLAAKGVVEHARAFVIHADSDGYATKFKPGIYRLHQNEPYNSLIAALVQGGKSPTVKVTIPEGTTLKQAAGMVSHNVSGVSSASYVAAARDHPQPFKLKGYKVGTTLEGMLFPATYDVDPKTKAKAFVQQQLQAFSVNFSDVDMTRARKANLTPYDVVIIASMVEREARVAGERPLVAAVIWNRLKTGMKLQIDATIQYALGKTKPVLTYKDLQIDSPYNTYKHFGLPPTPISNPGLAALQAAANPASVNYLYYVARNDGTGRHYFTNDYSQFLVDKAQAQANGQ
jgi:peptidoglycan lytic transglycosylase G